MNPASINKSKLVRKNDKLEEPGVRINRFEQYLVINGITTLFYRGKARVQKLVLYKMHSSAIQEKDVIILLDRCKLISTARTACYLDVVRYLVCCERLYCTKFVHILHLSINFAI